MRQIRYRSGVISNKGGTINFVWIVIFFKATCKKTFLWTDFVILCTQNVQYLRKNNFIIGFQFKGHWKFMRFRHIRIFYSVFDLKDINTKPFPLSFEYKEWQQQKVSIFCRLLVWPTFFLIFLFEILYYSHFAFF